MQTDGADTGVLALMGSGETSPTMVTLHRELIGRLGETSVAVVLPTPYGFQVNAADISERARRYFAHSVGLQTVIADNGGPAESGPGQRLLDLVRSADWVFAGPGSPSYALRAWDAARLAEALASRVRRARGVTVLASAAACTAGAAALPVYEIYKAGHEPHWLAGLDLLGELGLPVAVIPHYDNAEGGTHDTRYCYLGEPRLAALEKDLPGDSAVLGIDEHTAVIFNLANSDVRVWGRGVMTIRRHGTSTRIPAGATLTLTHLRDLVHGLAAREPSGRSPEVQGSSTSATARSDEPPAPLTESVAAAEARFESALQAADAGTVIEVILDLESTIAAWAGDTEQDQGTEWARAVLRAMIARLAEPTRRGLLEPGQTVARLAAPLVQIRNDLRTQGSYDLADQLRAILTGAGVTVHDTGQTSTWRFDAETATNTAAHR